MVPTSPDEHQTDDSIPSHCPRCQTETRAGQFRCAECETLLKAPTGAVYGWFHLALAWCVLGIGLIVTLVFLPGLAILGLVLVLPPAIVLTFLIGRSLIKSRRVTSFELGDAAARVVRMWFIYLGCLVLAIVSWFLLLFASCFVGGR
jgi:hypothetical protein